MYAARDKVLKFGQQDLAQVVVRDEDVGMLGARAGVMQGHGLTVSAPIAPPTPAPAPQPYPEESDGKIRRIAELLGRGEIIQLLDDVRNKLLGNAFQVQDKAVAGTWSGRAAAQFTTYAGSVGKALDEQQDVIGGMSGILSGIAGCVITTYGKAIEFIGTCAVELGKLGYKVIVAIATLIPAMPSNSGMDNEKQWRIEPTAAPA